MRRTNRLFGYLSLLLLRVMLIAQQATGTLKIHVLNVGQGDAIYIECPEPAHHNMLIDSGDVTAMRYPGSPKLFQEQLAELMGTRKRIDVVVSSHPHSDHAGSLFWVLSTYEVGKFIDDGMPYESSTHTKIDQRATELAGQSKLKFLARNGSAQQEQRTRLLPGHERRCHPLEAGRFRARGQSEQQFRSDSNQLQRPDLSV